MTNETGAIVATWRRPAMPEQSERAISELRELVNTIATNQFGQGQGTSPVTSCEVLINTSGSAPIGGVLIVRGEQEGLYQLQAMPEWREQIMRLSALFENFETNACVGGPDNRSIENALSQYKNVYNEVSQGSGPIRR